MHKYILILLIILGCLTIPSWAQDEAPDPNFKQETIAPIRTFSLLIVTQVTEKRLNKESSIDIRFRDDGDVRCCRREVQDTGTYHKLTEITVTTKLSEEQLRQIQVAFRALDITALKPQAVEADKDEAALNIVVVEATKDKVNRARFTCPMFGWSTKNAASVQTFLDTVNAIADQFK